MAGAVVPPCSVFVQRTFHRPMNFRDDEFDDLEDDDADDVDELEDIDGAAETLPCPECGAAIHEDALQCPVCGAYVTFGTSPWASRPWWWLTLGLLGTVAVIWALMQLRG
jgi:ribosomal protein S27AE